MDALRTKLSPEDVNFIVYHSECSDGFGAALCGYLTSKTITFYPGYFTPNRDDQKLMEQLEKHKSESKEPINLLILDFSYSRDFMIKLSKFVDKLLLLDHHESAEKDIGDLDFCYFESNRSGCTLAWEYFMGNTDYPELLIRIEDRDLWRWQVPQNKEFTSAFYNLVPFDFGAYKSFIDNPDLIRDCISQGSALLKYISIQVEKKASTCETVMTKSGKTIGILNLTENGSECGEFLTVNKGYDFCIVWNYNHKNNTIKGGIRSAQGTQNDCSKLGKMLGGGGHFNASGFNTKLDIVELIKTLEGLDL